VNGAALPSAAWPNILSSCVVPRGAGAPLIEAIYADFTATATKAYEKVQTHSRRGKGHARLAGDELILATTTGFDRPLCTAILARLGWQHYFAASITSDDVLDGRPAPYMLFRAMKPPMSMRRRR